MSGGMAMRILTLEEQTHMAERIKKGYEVREAGKHTEACDHWISAWENIRDRIGGAGESLSALLEEWQEKTDLVRWFKDARKLFEQMDPETAKEIAGFLDALESKDGNRPDASSQKKTKSDKNTKQEILDLQRKLTQAINTDVDDDGTKDR